MSAANSREVAKAIILEIVRQSGGEFQNKTNLYKAFWRAHLSYARRNLGYLSNWPIVRMPQGPGIDACDHLLADMLANDWLKIGERQVGNCTAMVLALGDSAPASTLNERQVAAVRDGVAAVKHKSARFVSDESHKDSRVWNEGKDGQALDIYLDLIPDEERDEYSKGCQSLIDALRAG